MPINPEPSPLRSSPMKIEPGMIINGRYRIDSYLGGGFFGAVYCAHDLLIDRATAMKVMRTFNSSKSEQRQVFIERFQREIQALAKLKHPNAVQVYDVGVIAEDPVPFMVMELLSGHNLREELEQSGPMEPSRVMRLLYGTLEALAEAHELGIIHKDLKPENLQLTDIGLPTERLRIMDFGLAHVTDDKRLTIKGEISGTMEYMAPEYVKHQEVTPAVDIYQMGLILVEMLSGRSLIPELTPLQQITLHVENALPIPDMVLGSPLGPFLMDVLAPEPGDRFPHAGAMLKALKLLDLSGMPRLEPDEPTTLINEIQRETSGPGAHTAMAQGLERREKRLKIIGVVAFVVIFLASLVALAVLGVFE